MTKCILCGLEIPRGKVSREHLVPKSRACTRITYNPKNIFPAAKIINSLKADLLPCEFWEQKYQLSYKAIKDWNIRREDKDYIRRAVINWQKGYQPNWCKICLLSCKGRNR